MKVNNFDYFLPPELIAQQPLRRRDSSRMMVLNRVKREIHHHRFRELPDFLQPGDLLVINVSRVLPVRVWGSVGSRKVEFLLVKPLRSAEWEVLCRPARVVKPGKKIVFSANLEAEAVAVGTRGRRILRFNQTDVLAEVKKIGFAPLPPYIKRPAEDWRHRVYDLRRYQTIYAREEGSIAAPTAGLHFTTGILKKLEEKGVELVRIILHVGLATFQPVEVEEVEKHRLGEENFVISPEAARKINQAKKEGRPVMAVGTTTVRALESAFDGEQVVPGQKATNLFIYPGYKFRVVDRLLTNFHLPRSTLLMLVAAFAGREFILQAYEEAVRQRYRFYSYGDCMLIL
jgi:S-adenosylmethionine:tRNA ribosyltransferase-isomerase